jgi:ribosomal-protein-alanine N-acetyltransferase
MSKPVVRAIRPMSMSDLDVVEDIQNRSSICPWPRHILETVCRQFEGYVISEGDTMIGFGFLLCQVEEVHILNIAILPHYQGRGIGRELMNFLVDRAKKHGGIYMILEVRPTNKTAISLYESMGFKKIGVRKGYYEIPDSIEREDAWVFSLRLVPRQSS